MIARAVVAGNGETRGKLVKIIGTGHAFREI
jgi:hypothetical protein